MELCFLLKQLYFLYFAQFKYLHEYLRIGQSHAPIKSFSPVKIGENPKEF